MAADNPYEAPTAGLGLGETASRRRSLALTIFLVWASFTSLSTPLILVLSWEQMAEIYPQWALLALAAVAAARPVVTLGLWFWSRLAVMLYAALSGVAIAVSVAAGYTRGFAGLVGVLLLIFVFRKYWASMPWLLANNSSKPTPLRGAA